MSPISQIFRFLFKGTTVGLAGISEGNLLTSKKENVGPASAKKIAKEKGIIEVRQKGNRNLLWGALLAKEGNEDFL